MYRLDAFAYLGGLLYTGIRNNFSAPLEGRFITAAFAYIPANISIHHRCKWCAGERKKSERERERERMLISHRRSIAYGP